VTGREAEPTGQIVHRRLGALSDSLGAQAANANVTLSNFAALETRSRRAAWLTWIGIASAAILSNESTCAASRG
jgi:hypothetical protein